MKIIKEKLTTSQINLFTKRSNLAKKKYKYMNKLLPCSRRILIFSTTFIITVLIDLSSYSLPVEALLLGFKLLFGVWCMGSLGEYAAYILLIRLTDVRIKGISKKLTI
jgi:hypothetical protein